MKFLFVINLRTEWWGASVVICLERGADLHTAHLMPLPLTVSCFSKIQIGVTFLVPAHLGSPGQRAIKWVCVCNLQTVWIDIEISRAYLMYTLCSKKWNKIKKSSLSSKLKGVSHDGHLSSDNVLKLKELSTNTELSRKGFFVNHCITCCFAINVFAQLTFQ